MDAYACILRKRAFSLSTPTPKNEVPSQIAQAPPAKPPHTPKASRKPPPATITQRQNQARRMRLQQGKEADKPLTKPKRKG